MNEYFGRTIGTMLGGCVLVATALLAAIPAALAQEASTPYAPDVTQVRFVGQLVELENTTPPATIVVSSASQSIVVHVTSKTKIVRQKFSLLAGLDEFIVGDQVEVRGTKNADDSVTATRLRDLSLFGGTRGMNGWITGIDAGGSTITILWKGKLEEITITEKTRIVIPGVTVAGSLNDLKVGDRIRGRVIKNDQAGGVEARIIILLRRGDVNYIKARTLNILGTLTELGSTTVPTDIKVESGGMSYTVQVTERTAIVRKHFGKSALDEFIAGDQVRVIAKKNDDGTLMALLLKNNSIWMVGRGIVNGFVKSIDTAASTITLSWATATPILKITDTTRIHIPGENPNAKITDILVGDRVRGRGVYNKTTNTITVTLLVVLRRAGAEATVIEISSDGTFNPSSVTVKKGTTVRWKNKDLDNHQIASNPHPTHTDLPDLLSSVLGPEESYSYKFDTVGTWGYHDHLNPSVTGTIVVEE